MQNLSRLRQAAVEKSKRKNTDTTQVVKSSGIKVSVSTKVIQKSVSKVIEEKRKILEKVTSDIKKVKAETEQIAEGIVSKARVEAQGITKSVQKMYEQAHSELEQAKKAQVSATQSAQGLKSAQKQLEVDKVAIESTRERIEKVKIDTVTQNTLLNQRVDEIGDLLDNLSIMVRLIVKNLEPTIKNMEKERVSLTVSLEKVREANRLIEIERDRLNAKEYFLDGVGIQQSTEWAIINDRREQLDRVAFELKQKKHG